MPGLLSLLVRYRPVKRGACFSRNARDALGRVGAAVQAGQGVLLPAQPLLQRRLHGRPDQPQHRPGGQRGHPGRLLGLGQGGLKQAPGLDHLGDPPQPPGLLGGQAPPGQQHVDGHERTADSASATAARSPATSARHPADLGGGAPSG
jgi:hypothetical protein